MIGGAPENDHGEVELLILLGAAIRWVPSMSKAQRPALALSPAVAGLSDFSIIFTIYCSIFNYTIYNIYYSSSKLV